MPGDEAPTRHHLALECPDVFLCPRLPASSGRKELVALLRRSGEGGRVPLMASDGGGLTRPGMGPWQRGSWTVVAYDEGVSCTVSGLLGGLEQTPAAAERMAVFAAAIQLQAAHVRVRGVINNDAAVRRLRHGIHASS